MSRAFWKGNYIQGRIEHHRHFALANTMVLYRRNVFLNKPFLNNTFEVYNGLSFDTVRINPDLLGQNLSAFSATKHFTVKKKKSKLKKKKGGAQKAAKPTVKKAVASKKKK